MSVDMPAAFPLPCLAMVVKINCVFPNATAHLNDHSILRHGRGIEGYVLGCNTRSRAE